MRTTKDDILGYLKALKSRKANVREKAVLALGRIGNRSAVPERLKNPAKQVNDEDYIAELRSKSYIEHGTDLECMVCHDKFDQLISGTCEVCFRKWALSTKKR